MALVVLADLVVSEVSVALVDWEEHFLIWLLAAVLMGWAVSVAWTRI